MKSGSAEYAKVHYWIRKQAGTPMKCVECKTTSSKKYHWANLSGEYKREISDWKRLCPRCHFLRDKKKEVCTKGHRLTPENTIIRKDRGHRICKICKRKDFRVYAKRRELREKRLLKCIKEVLEVAKMIESKWPVWMGTPETKTDVDKIRALISKMEAEGVQ